MRAAKDTPNGAQLSTWRALEQAAESFDRLYRGLNKDRRNRTWRRWAWDSTRRQARFVPTHIRRALRAALCRQHGVPNTGRQWRKLRKRLARRGRPA